MATATKKKASAGIKLQPLGDRIVLRREESESTTAGGIVLPSAAQQQSSRGEVVSVGNGRLLEDGSRAPLQVKPGDRVLFQSYGPEMFKIGEEELLLLSEGDILCVIEG